MVKRQTPASPNKISKKTHSRSSLHLPAKEPKLRGKRIIPVCEAWITAKERRYVAEAIRSAWVSSEGSFVERFERAFARTVSRTNYAVAVNSGTSALHLALAALDIGPGDEVIIPALTMIATALPVFYLGAKPVLVDSE